jgi:BlaI family penicillinase repressor
VLERGGILVQGSLPDLGKAEWRVMEALWARGHATAVELQADLAADEGWAYSTVKTMLDRLVEKGYVKAQRTGNVYVYTPRVRRGSAVARVVDDVVDRVLEGSVAAFVGRLVERRRLKPDEIDQLRRMLEDYGSQSGDAS